MQVEGKNVTDGESVVMKRPGDKFPAFGGGGCVCADGTMKGEKCDLSPVL